MGRDKALLPWRDGTLLDHALARLRQVTPDVRILSGPSRRYADRGASVHTDVVAGLGPLGGLLTALETSTAEHALVLAVDLPQVPVALLSFLVASAPGHDVSVPVTARGAEPLCAVYARTCLAPIREGVARGELRMTSFWTGLRVRTIGEAELARWGAVEELFVNVNAPEDWTAAGARGR
jgi:molybdenum cofactor guanylyltransferase